MDEADVPATGFYGAEQARIHDEHFGLLPRRAAAMVVALLAERGLVSGRITDLACGSGIVTAGLLAAGYEVDASDLSADMVALAARNAPAAHLVVAPMLDVPIRPSVAVTAIGEAVCYATDPRTGLEALAGLARRVFDALVPGGLFVFDVSGPGRNLGLDVRHVFHDWGERALGMHAVEAPGRLDRRIVIFEREPDGRYRRVDEHHVARLYERDDVVSLLEEAGFSVEVREDYVQGDDARAMPGWFVVVASKP